MIVGRSVLAAADGGEEGDFVGGGEGLVGEGVLVVDGDEYGFDGGCQIGVLLADFGEQVLDGGLIGGEGEAELVGAGAGAQGRSDDIAPSHQVPALATAEIFDPATGTWSPTGAMRFARAGATAVTLTDGRVLVVSPGGELWVATDTGASLDPRASGTTEIYDAATGRFTLAGDIPAFDRAAIAAAGVVLPDTSPWQVSTGTLVALPDGGALLVGRSDAWKHEGSVTRTLRFDAGTARWTQVGPAYACLTDFTANGSHCTPGVDLANAFAAALPDGRVLAAGGWTATAGGGTDASRQAQAFDATTSAWSPLPSMPDARASGRTAVLSDGSVLLVGGNDSSAGPVTAVRFVLSP